MVRTAAGRVVWHSSLARSSGCEGNTMGVNDVELGVPSRGTNLKGHVGSALVAPSITSTEDCPSPVHPGMRATPAGKDAVNESISWRSKFRTLRHSLQAPQSQAHKHRSKRLTLGLFTERCSTPSWWRRAKISSCKAARVRKTHSVVVNNAENTAVGEN